MSEDEEAGGGSGNDDLEMVYDSQSCSISGSGAGFDGSRGVRALAAVPEPPPLLDFPTMDQFSIPGWEMFDAAALVQQPPLSTNSNLWAQFETPVDSCWTSMLYENAFDFSFLDEGGLKSMLGNQGGLSQAHLIESPSGSSPKTSDRAHVSGEHKGSVTVVLKGKFGLTQELVESLMKVNGDLTIHVLKD
jgi:hypothetical protein